MKYKVFLTYVKPVVVEADNFDEAIQKAQNGDILKKGKLIATPEDDYADLISKETKEGDKKHEDD